MKKLLIIIFLVITIGCKSQTTFYLSASLVPGPSPAFQAAWNVTTGGARRMMKPVKDASTIASVTSGQTGAAAVRKVLIRQFVSEPLAAQTLNGTLTGQIRFNMSSVTSVTGQGFVYFRIINADGTVASEVGTMTTTDLTTTLTNRTLIALTLSSVAVTAGQRFAIDVGWNFATGSTTTITATGSFGSSSATDLAVDNTTTTANNPFIKFSQTIIFQNPSRGFF